MLLGGDYPGSNCTSSCAASGANAGDASPGQPGPDAGLHTGHHGNPRLLRAQRGRNAAQAGCRGVRLSVTRLRSSSCRARLRKSPVSLAPISAAASMRSRIRRCKRCQRRQFPAADSIKKLHDGRCWRDVQYTVPGYDQLEMRANIGEFDGIVRSGQIRLS